MHRPHTKRVGSRLRKLKSKTKGLSGKLCSRDLQKCLHGKTQNANESFNGTLWQRVSKEVFVWLKTVKLRAYDAAIQFNEGYMGCLKVSEKLNIENPGFFTPKGYKHLDNLRIQESKRLSTAYQLTKFGSKQPMLLFYVQVANSLNVAEIHGISEMFGTRVSIEKLRERNSPNVFEDRASGITNLRNRLLNIIRSNPTPNFTRTQSYQPKQSNSSYSDVVANRTEIVQQSDYKQSPLLQWENQESKAAPHSLHLGSRAIQNFGAFRARHNDKLPRLTGGY
ncbi:uncharacterized protein CEXT_435341 [Caerostris extrusa]|uniref:Uncharacterized protein n=1 Tax=Caerostris extrusa TaxID=172846 RepID=A0AAV4SLJ0_CAEEX|nr:uncharacterized protein CEXT_435341 [Caerostris extrusa]